MDNSSQLPIWVYSGPVMSFGKIIDSHWTYRTRAISQGRAITNLSFKYKMIKQLEKNYQIELDLRYLKKEIIKKGK